MSTCFWIVFGERSEAARCLRNARNGTSRLLARRQIFFQPHPRAWPAVQIAAVILKVIARPGGGAVYFGSSRRCPLPLHAPAHRDSKPLTPFSRIRLSSRPLQFRSQEHRGRRPRKGSAVCSRCHQLGRGYDQLSERRFEFIPFCGFLVFLLTPCAASIAAAAWRCPYQAPSTRPDESAIYGCQCEQKRRQGYDVIEAG